MSEPSTNTGRHDNRPGDKPRPGEDTVHPYDQGAGDSGGTSFGPPLRLR